MSAPGWYPDPQNPRNLRWWDGTTWTGDVATPGADPGTAADPSGAPAPGSWGPGTAPMGPVPMGTAPPGAMPAGPPPLPTGPPAKAKTNPWLIGGLVGGAVVIVALIAIVPYLVGRSADPAPPPTASPRTTTEDGGATPSRLDQLADEAGIPVLDEEGFVTHTHTLVRVVVDGDELVVPAFIGIDDRRGKIAAVHTHDETGAVHIESPHENDVYTVGQFLTLWGAGTTEEDLCTFFVEETSCSVTVEVRGASASERRELDSLGPWRDEPTTGADGLDTELIQGNVVEVTVERA